jgi:hypothetical protein
MRANNAPPVRTVKVADRTLIVRASFFEAIGIADPLPEAVRPVAITAKQAMELSNLSRSTIDNMIRAGRQAQAENQDTAAA